MSEEITPKFVYLHDTASNEDAFDGGHEKTSDAIFDFIESNTGGMIIGLEGKWGSGKSTIIEMLKTRLSNSRNKYLVFTFDAWAHEGDPLRRTFLCTLLDFLQKEKCFEEYDQTSSSSGSYQKLKKDSINGTHSKTTTISRPKVTATGVAAALSTLFLIPISHTLFKRAVDIGITFCRGCSLNLPLIFSFIFSILPFLIVNCVYKREFKQNFRSRKEKSEEENLNSKISKTQLEMHEIDIEKNRKTNNKLITILKDIFSSFITKEGETETITDTYETPNPTSVEFEEIFLEIMSTAKHPTCPDWKLILILDNLDRIQPEDTKAILSTLQTFLQYQQRMDENKNLENIWTIIPYDPEGMRKVWRGKEFKNGGVENDGNYARRMLEKRFQIRFYAPPIIFTGWKRYMLDKLNEAFPSPTKFDDNRNKVFDSIYNIYSLFIDWWSKEPKKIQNSELEGDEVLPISPRDLIIFINQMGTLYQQWGSKEAKVRLENMAIFILLKTRNPQINIPHFLRNNQEKVMLPESIRNLYLKNDIDWKGDLAVLWFNVNRERAKVLLIQDEVFTALSEADVERLNKINNENIGVFDTIEVMIYSRVISSKIQNRDEYLRTVHTIYQSQLIDDAKKKKWVIEDFLNIFTGDYVEDFNIANASYLISLWKLFNECNLDYDLFENVKSEFHSFVYTSQKGNSEIRDKIIDNWIEGLEYLYNNLSPSEFAQLSLVEEKLPFKNDRDEEKSDDLDKRLGAMIYSWGILDKVDQELHQVFIPNEGFEVEKLDKHFSLMVSSSIFRPSLESLSFYPVFRIPNQVINSIKGAKKIYSGLTFSETTKSALQLLRDSRQQIDGFPTIEHVTNIFILLEEINGIEATAKLFDQKPQDNNLLLAYFGYILRKYQEAEGSDDYDFLGFFFLIILLNNKNLDSTDSGLAKEAKDFIMNQLLTETLSYPNIMEAFKKAYLDCESEIKSKLLIGLPNIKPSAFGFVGLSTLSFIDILDLDKRNELLKYLISNWKKFITEVNHNLQDRIISGLIHSNFVAETFEIAKSITNDNSFNFLTMVSNSSEFNNNHKHKLVQYLDYETSQWEKILIREDAVIFLNTLKSKFKRLTLTEKYTAAVKTVATKMLSNELNLQVDFVQHWNKIIELIPNQETFNKDIYSNFKINNLQIINVQFLDYFGANLFSRVNLENNTETIINDLIKPQLLNHPVKSSEHVLKLFEDCGKRKLGQIINNQGELATLRQEMINKIEEGLPSTTVDIFNKIIGYLPDHYD